MMHEHSHSGFNAGHLLLALMGGAVAGAGVAYLTAPASGLETRHRMRVMAHDTNMAVQHLPDALRKATEAAREAFIGALELEEGEVTESKGRRKAMTAKASKSKRA